MINRVPESLEWMGIEVAAFAGLKVKLVRIVRQVFDGDLTVCVWSCFFDSNLPMIDRIVAVIRRSDEINFVRKPRSPAVPAGGHSKLCIPKIMRTHSSYTLLAVLT